MRIAEREELTLMEKKWKVGEGRQKNAKMGNEGKERGQKGQKDGRRKKRKRKKWEAWGIGPEKDEEERQ
ncbi:hypothetical protein NDU88_005569 [Pleurodeles waltl]|uniref:Uncharacterized protein n=1 Tax=Pleurodeles waltl TaxID=8319 RepID=A0AAV7PIH8_PLEWA|nr:hypothetical protein NDU88_005569 [Pleurodeles waltl]